MRAAGVKVVVVMGVTAQKALGVAGRGTVVARDGLVFVSTHHPAFVLRGGGGRKEGSREPLAALIADKGPQAALAQISGLDAASDVVAEAVNDYNAEK